MTFSQVLREMLTSKKFIAAMAGLVVGLAGRFGLDLDIESIIAVLSPLVAYIIGQGLADFGKEALRIDGRNRSAE